MLLICQIHDTLVSRLAWQSNWFILQTLKITIIDKELLFNTTFMSLLQPGFLLKIWSLDHSFNSTHNFPQAINVVSLGIDLGGIEVGKYALFISNVISCFSFLIFLRHFYVKFDELHSGRNKIQLNLLDLCLCYFSIVQVKPSM